MKVDFLNTTFARLMFVSVKYSKMTRSDSSDHQTPNNAQLDALYLRMCVHSFTYRNI